MKKFSETYPNGIKKTSFMGRLQDRSYRYYENLGGLCNICSEYFYNVFEKLANLIRNYTKDINQVCFVYIFFDTNIVLFIEHYFSNFIIINRKNFYMK